VPNRALAECTNSINDHPQSEARVCQGEDVLFFGCLAGTATIPELEEERTADLAKGCGGADNPCDGTPPLCPPGTITEICEYPTEGAASGSPEDDPPVAEDPAQSQDGFVDPDNVAPDPDKVAPEPPPEVGTGVPPAETGVPPADESTDAGSEGDTQGAGIEGTGTEQDAAAPDIPEEPKDEGSTSEKIVAEPEPEPETKPETIPEAAFASIPPEEGPRIDHGHGSNGRSDGDVQRQGKGKQHQDDGNNQSQKHKKKNKKQCQTKKKKQCRHQRGEGNQPQGGGNKQCRKHKEQCQRHHNGKGGGFGPDVEVNPAIPAGGQYFTGRGWEELISMLMSAFGQHQRVGDPSWGEPFVAQGSDYPFWPTLGMGGLPGGAGTSPGTVTGQQSTFPTVTQPQPTTSFLF